MSTAVDTRPPPLRQFAADCGLELEPFQRRIARAAAGPEPELAVLLPRGNGKTALVAVLALHHLISVEGAAVYCAASSREQARVLYEYAAAFARRIGHPNVVFRHLELRWCDDPAEPKVFTRHLRVLAADAMRLHGLTPTLAVVDELHAHPDDRVYVALKTAQVKTPGSRLLVISSAGQGADSPLGRLRARALAQPSVTRSGALTDARGPDIRMLEWSLPEGAELDDAQAVKRANPASWITVDGLRAQRAALPEIAFARFHAGVWTEREGHWLPAGAWQAIVGEPQFEDGEKVWVGIDVGGERSASAVAWVSETLNVGCEVFQGEDAVLEVGEVVRELARTYAVAEVTADPMRAGQLLAELERERLRVTVFPQTDSRMIPASQRLHAAVVERRLTVPDDPELTRHAADAVARHSRRGWRVASPARGVAVDAVVALAMALDVMEDRPPPARLIGWL